MRELNILKSENNLLEQLNDFKGIYETYKQIKELKEKNTFFQSEEFKGSVDSWNKKFESTLKKILRDSLKKNNNNFDKAREEIFKTIEQTKFKTEDKNAVKKIVEEKLSEWKKAQEKAQNISKSLKTVQLV